MTELDNEFKELANQINAKILEAAKVMKELNALREKAGLDSLIPSEWFFDRLGTDQKTREVWEAKFNLIDVISLERELDLAGWQSSASYC